MIGARAYLSLGSNVGPREATILRAVRLVDDLVASVRGVSSLYETEPVDCESMRRFVNAVAEVRSSLAPQSLLGRLQAIEKEAGRRGGHNRPRALDIDIVAFGDEVIRSSRLVVPHPRYFRRRFVLLPLQELAPDFRCPVTGRRIDEMIAALGPGQEVVCISGRRLLSASSDAPDHRLEVQHG